MPKLTMESLRLSNLLSAIREEFCKIPDRRSPESSAFAFPLPEVLMSGLAMMFLQDPSLLAFQRHLHERHRRNNLQTIFHVNEVPGDSQFRRLLDPIEPYHLLKALNLCIHKLQPTKFWKEFRVLDGRYAVIFDGFEFFRSSRKGCSHCLEFNHKDGHVDYAHKALAVAFANPLKKLPIPIIVEEIRQEDGKTKQDCEMNAAKRIIPELAKQHSHMSMVIVADDLFSKLPIVKQIESSGMEYILVAKPADHQHIEENLTGIRKTGGVEHLKFKNDDGSVHEYEWAHDLELVGKSDYKTHWFACKIISKAGKTYKNSWITNIKPTRYNIKELVSVGRSRWQIENQVFDLLKNHGQHLEHNFGHGKEHLAFNFIILNFIAYMLQQILKMSDRLYNLTLEWMGPRYEFWESIRALIHFFIWADWESLLKHMLDGDDESALDSS